MKCYEMWDGKLVEYALLDEHFTYPGGSEEKYKIRTKAGGIVICSKDAVHLTKLAAWEEYMVNLKQNLLKAESTLQKTKQEITWTTEQIDVVSVEIQRLKEENEKMAKV